MFKKNNYDFEIYKELRKLNETLDKRGNLHEDTGIRNKLELEYILDNAWKYYSEKIGEIRFLPGHERWKSARYRQCQDCRSHTAPSAVRRLYHTC